MDMTKNRRRNYFIKKAFQRKFILKFCGLVILGLGISGFIVYLFSRGTVTTTFVRSRLSIVNTADYILPGLLGSSVITIILISLAAAFVLMFLSHRIAGPLYKIEKSAEEIGAGNLNPRIKLRSTDEMVKLADCFNEMTKNLRERFLEIKTKSDELWRETDNLSKSGKNQDAIKKIQEKKKALDKAFDYFKIT